MAIKAGEDFEMISFDSTQVRIDGDAVKALLAELQEKNLVTPAQVMACYKEIHMSTIKTTRKDKSLAPVFSMPDFSNATASGVVDMLGSLREKMKLDKKLEGLYKTKLMSLLVASGEAAPSAAPPMEEWLKEKIYGGGDEE